jgi:FSR family fosmidomycin resistance protein-like MFS transporter
VTARRPIASVGVLALGHLVNDGYAFMLPALLPALLGRLDVGLGVGGLLLTLYLAASSFTQPLFGHFGDRGGRKRWMAWAGVVMSGVGMAALGFVSNVWGVALAILVAGLGTSLFHPASAALVASTTPPGNHARWMSVYMSAGNFGLPLGPLFIGIVIGAASLGGLWIVGFPAIVAGLLVVWLAPQETRAPTSSVSLPAVLREHARMLAALVTVAAVRGWSNALASSFLALYGVSLGASVADASHLLSLYLLAGAVGSLACGWLGDRFGRDRLIVASFVAAAPFCLLLALQSTVGPVFLVAAAVSGVLLNGSFVLLAVRGQESLPGSIGMVSGMMLGLSIGLGGLAVAPMALVAERVGLPSVFLVAGALSIVGALLMPLVPPPPARTPSSRLAAATM